MTVIDVHPDELLERELAGTLSLADSRRLAEHLARCGACRLERQLRADFDCELGEQAAPDMLQALVFGALRAARAPEVPRLPERESPNRRPSRRGLRRPVSVLVAVAVALATGLAAARPDLARRAVDLAREQVLTLLGSAPSAPAPTVVRAHSTSAARRRSPADEPRAQERDVALSAAPEPPELPEPPKPASLDVGPPHDAAVTPITAARSTGLVAQRRAPRRERRVGTPSPRADSPSTERASDVETHRAQSEAESESEPVRKELAAVTAADLFDRANAARRRGTAAEPLYRQLLFRFPDSAEARLSTAILGRMRLDAGDAEAALTHLDAYLASGDAALREQALANRALAWGLLGRSERERQSWQTLLDAYPHSSYTPMAQQRLARGSR